MKRIISGIIIICILFGSVDLSAFASSNFSGDYSYYSGKSVTELYNYVSEGCNSGAFDATNKHLGDILVDLYVRIAVYGVHDLVAYCYWTNDYGNWFRTCTVCYIKYWT